MMEICFTVFGRMATRKLGFRLEIPAFRQNQGRYAIGSSLKALRVLSRLLGRDLFFGQNHLPPGVFLKVLPISKTFKKKPNDFLENRKQTVPKLVESCDGREANVR